VVEKFRRGGEKKNGKKRNVIGGIKSKRFLPRGCSAEKGGGKTGGRAEAGMGGM